MIIILNISADKFSLNGIPYFKNFMPYVLAGKLKIVNIYDTKFQLTEFDSFNKYSVDGVVYTNLADLQNALLPVLYTRNTLNPNNYFPKHNDLVGLNEGIDFLHLNKTEKDKLSNLSGINTGDQDLSPYALVTYVEEQIGNIQEILSSDNLDLDTFQEFVDAILKLQNDLNNISVNDATNAVKGIIKLAGDLGGTADLPTVPELANKLTGTIATDAETQITAAVIEDNKMVSRLKLFNWWNWVKNQKQVIAASWDFRGTIRTIPLSGTYPYANIDNANIGLYLSDTSSVSFGTSTTGSVSYRRGGFQSNVVQNPLSSNRVIYYPDASGTVLLKETFTSLEISQFQKNGTSPMYIRVNNFTSDVLEDLRIILGAGTNIPYFQRCVLANANKGGGMWERAVSTVKLNNTNVAVSSLAVNTGVLMQISDPLLFTWAVDTQSSKTSALVSELINGDYVKDVDDKTANNFRITFEVSYPAGAGDGTLELSIVNPSLSVIDQGTVTINIDGKGATKKRVVFNVRAVKTQDNNTGYRLRLNNGSKEITEYRLLNILRTNN